MNLYVDLATRRIVFSPKLNKELARVDVKRGDVFPLSIVFLSNGKPVQIAANTDIAFCAKKKNDFEGDALVLTESFTLTNANTDNPSYDGVINLNSDNLADYLDNAANTADDFIFADLHSEINWSNANEAFTTNTLILRVYNDIYKGDEGNPVITPGAPFVFPDGLQTATIAGINGGPVTINATLVASHIHGNIAGSVYTHARAGEQIYKGNPVYVSSYYTSAGVIYPVVSRADASNAAKMPAIGIASADAANNADTHVIIIGQVESLNTQSFNANAELYVASGGGLTATQPADRAQLVARVERSQQNNGAILVTIGESSASNATINTIVRRDSAGAAKFNGLTIPSFTSGNVVTVTTSGAFASTPSSGIDTRSTFPNADVTAATSLATPNTIVKRNGIGSIEVSNVTTGSILTGDLTITDSISFEALTYVFATGADQGFKNALGITFSDILDAESGTAYLNLSTLNLAEPITSGLKTKLVFTAQPLSPGDGQQIIWQWENAGSPITTAVISTEATGSNSDKLIFKTTDGGSLGTSLDLTNALATFSGVVSSFGASYQTGSTFTYAAGAAAAHRAALGVLEKQSKFTTVAVTSNNGTQADVAGLTGFTLEANTTYRLTIWSLITTASGGSFEFYFSCSGTTFLGGTSQAGSGIQRSAGVLAGGYVYSTTQFSPLYSTQNLTNAPTYGEYYFRTGSTAGTGKVSFAQRPASTVGTTTIAAGTTAILEKIS